MKLRTVAIEATDDTGNRIAGPWPLPLTREAKQELRTLIREYGPLEKPCTKSS